MTWKQFTIKMISECISLKNFFLKPEEGFRILTYHSIGAPAYGDKLGIYSLSVERFMQHLDVLATMKTVALLPIVISQNKQSTAVTFDDGYADNLYVAAPLLVSRNIPFTVFTVASFIQKKQKGFLSPNELKELSKIPGAKIGSHGLTHCNLTLCSNQMLRSELKDSKHYIEDLIGMPVMEFSYPYGMLDMRVRDAVEEAGYLAAVCSRFDINRANQDVFMMNRCEIISSDGPRTFQQKLNGSWDWYRFRHESMLNIIKGYK